MSGTADTSLGPLSGIRVVDFSKQLAGPKAAMILADLGADVIKVEGRGFEDQGRLLGNPPGLPFAVANRNKRSIVVDFNGDEGRNVVKRLIQSSDVLVEAYRPGTMERLGLGYSELAGEAPRLIYASVSGFGSDGPSAKRGGMDTIIQAESGLMYNTGVPDGPPVLLGGYIIDETAGMTLAQGIMLALYTREKTGHGEHVEVSLFDAAIYLQSIEIATSSLTGEQPPRSGNMIDIVAPAGVVQAADGPMVLVALGDQTFRRLCDVIGKPALCSDARFVTNADRTAHHAALLDLLDEALETRTRTEWAELLQPEKILVAPVRKYADVLQAPELTDRERLVPFRHHGQDLTLARWPVNISGESFPATAEPAPAAGEHTNRILTELGYSDDDIARLERAGTIAGGPSPHT